MYSSKFDLPKPQEETSLDSAFRLYHSPEVGLMKWSNSRPLPDLGAKIKVTSNGIGPATVIGYFSETVDEGSYVGVMTVAHNPPKWLKDQNRAGAAKADKPLWYRAGIGCIYGTECEV